jgi:hypothetical protein
MASKAAIPRDEMARLIDLCFERVLDDGERMSGMNISARKKMKQLCQWWRKPGLIS